jgi:hypothetical protein
MVCVPAREQAAIQQPKISRAMPFTPPALVRVKGFLRRHEGAAQYEQQ